MFGLITVQRLPPQAFDPNIKGLPGLPRHVKLWGSAAVQPSRDSHLVAGDVFCDRVLPNVQYSSEVSSPRPRLLPKGDRLSPKGSRMRFDLLVPRVIFSYLT